jgi:hypothetical protein
MFKKNSQSIDFTAKKDDVNFTSPSISGEINEIIIAKMQETVANSMQKVLNLAFSSPDFTMSGLESQMVEVSKSIGQVGLAGILSQLPETAPICPNCGKPMKNHGSRPKQLVTLLGDIEYSRNYYVCECSVPGSTPKDDRLEVKGTSFTPGVKQNIGIIAASDSFTDTSAKLKDLCGVAVSAKECEMIAENLGDEIIKKKDAEINDIFNNLNPMGLTPIKPILRLYVEYDGKGIPIRKNELQGVKGKQEDGTAKTKEAKTGCIFTQTNFDEEGKPIRDPKSTTYFGMIGSPEEFGKLLYLESVRRGVDHAQEVIILGDGAPWIWNLASEIYPKERIEIVDLFHAKEHVCDLVKSIIHDDKEVKKKKDELFNLLDEGEIMKLTEEFKKLGAKTNEQLNKVRRETNYFLKNIERMKYKEFRSKGLFVGSGVIEAACKNVVGGRLAKSGSKWTIAGANKILALRCDKLSADVEDCLPKAA